MSKRSKGKFAFISVITLLFIFILACSGSTPEVKLPNQSTTQTQGQPTNSSKPIGSARSNPAPLGSEVTIDNMAILVKEVVSPADDIVVKGNMFNSTPDPSSRYILVNILVTCKKSTDDKCNLLGFEFKVIDTSGVSHDVEFVAGVAGEFEAGEFYGGATKSGYLPYMVPKNDNGLILIYSGLLTGEAYLSL